MFSRATNGQPRSRPLPLSGGWQREAHLSSADNFSSDVCRWSALTCVRCNSSLSSCRFSRVSCISPRTPCSCPSRVSARCTEFRLSTSQRWSFSSKSTTAGGRRRGRKGFHNERSMFSSVLESQKSKGNGP